MVHDSQTASAPRDVARLDTHRHRSRRTAEGHYREDKRNSLRRHLCHPASVDDGPHGGFAPPSSTKGSRRGPTQEVFTLLESALPSRLPPPRVLQLESQRPGGGRNPPGSTLRLPILAIADRVPA